MEPDNKLVLQFQDILPDTIEKSNLHIVNQEQSDEESKEDLAEDEELLNEEASQEEEKSEEEPHMNSQEEITSFKEFHREMQS